MSQTIDWQGLEVFTTKQHQTFYSIYHQIHHFFEKYTAVAIIKIVDYFKQINFDYYKSLNPDMPTIEPLEICIVDKCTFRWEVRKIVEWEKDILNVIQSQSESQYKSDFLMQRVFTVLFGLFQKTHIHNTILNQHFYIVPMIEMAIKGSNICFDTITSFNQMLKQFFILCWNTYLAEFKTKTIYTEDVKH